MNKLFKLILVAIIPFLSLNSSELKRGVDVVAEVIEEYSSGKADDFLREIDKEYFEKRASLNWVLDLRKEHSHLAGKSLPKQDTKRRNYAIGRAIAHSDEELARGLKESFGFALSKEEEKAAHTLKTLHMKFLGQGDTPLENRLIEIDVEFDLKRQLLDTAYSQEKTVNLDQYQTKQLYLEIEKLEQMLKVCKEEPDQALSKQVTLALKVMPKMLATRFDEANLRALGSKNFTPTTPLEAELQAIMKEFLK